MPIYSNILKYFEYLSATLFVCRRYFVYARKSYELLKVVENRIKQCCAAHIVSNAEQVVEPESSPQSGVTIQNNVVSMQLY